MKRILCLIMVIAIMFTVMPATVYGAETIDSGTCGDDLTWVLDEDGTLTISGEGEMWDYDTSETPWDDYRSYIETIIIEEGVTSIGHWAFDSFELLNSVEVANSVYYIGEYAFSSCWSLNEISLPDSVNYIGEGAFSWCDSLVSFTVPICVDTILDYTFAWCTSLESIYISTHLSYIEEYVFYECSALTDVYYDGTEDDWNNIEIGNTNNYLTMADKYNYGFCGDNVIWKLDFDGTLTISGEGEMWNYDYWNLPDWFNLRENIVEVIIEDGVNFIGEYAFLKCSSLQSVELSKSVTSIGYAAFRECSELTDIEIVEGVKVIDEFVFDDCISLEYIYIPSTVEHVEISAFYNCASLSDIDVSENNKYYTSKDGVLFNKDLTELLRYPNNNNNINYSIPNKVKVINSGAFRYCELIKSITISNNVEEIRTNTFEGCSSLEEINVLEDNKYYSSKDGVLFDKGITELVKYPIGKNASFYSIPTGVNSIGIYAFYGCKNLSSITMGNDVKKIEYAAFGNTAWYENQADGILYLDNWCLGYKGDRLDNKEIQIKDGIVGIADDSFLWCESLETITIPKTVESIGDRAFENCYSLTDVYYGGTEEEWNNIAIGEENDYLTDAEIHFTEEENGLFKLTRDTYSFANNRESFGYEKNYVLDFERYEKAYGLVKGTLKYNGCAITVWNGSCFGMSATSGLFYNNTLDYKRYDKNANSVYNISAPENKNSGLTMITELYQLAKDIESVSLERSNNSIKNNENCVRELINAVKSFEENGEKPLVLCVYGELGKSHALLPYKCVENSNGTYSIYVYDCNTPSKEDKYVLVDADKNTFKYENQNTVYKKNLAYNYVDTVQIAIEESQATLMDDSMDNTFTLIVNSGDVNINDAQDYADAENITGAYEVIPIELEYNTDRTEYVLPNAEYLIKNNDMTLEKFEVSVANSMDYQTISTEDLKAKIIVGVDGSTGRLYLRAESSGSTSQSMTVMDDNGITKVLETDGSTIGVKVNKAGTLNVKSNSVVYVNGSEAELNSNGETDYDIDREPDINSGTENGGYTILDKRNTLKYSNGTLNGSFSFAVYNTMGDVRSARVVAALYSKDGALVSLLKNDDTVLGIEENYINLGTLNYGGLKADDYYIKVFVWDSIQTLEPIADAKSFEIQ